MMRRWYAQPVPWGIFVFTILLLGVAFGLGVAFAVRSAIDSHDAKTAAAIAKIVATRQQEGRAVAIDFLCGGLSGVEAAGKKALRGELPGQRGQGLPNSAIAEYNATISRRIILQARVNAKGILDEQTGRIDCDALGQAAKAHP